MRDDIQKLLTRAAEHLEISPDDVLARVLHADDKSRNEVLQYVGFIESTAQKTFLRFDEEMRVRWPGLHYAMRATYLGYRIEERPGVETLGARTQIVASVLRRSRVLTVVVPMVTADFEGRLAVQDVGNQGHHGIGQSKCVIAGESDLNEFLAVFDAWHLKRAKSS